MRRCPYTIPHYELLRLAKNRVADVRDPACAHDHPAPEDTECPEKGCQGGIPPNEYKLLTPVEAIREDALAVFVFYYLN